MKKEPYPWRKHSDLRVVLAAAKPVLASIGVVEPGGGCAAEEMTAAERRIGAPLPRDVRAFYRAMRPRPIFEKGKKEFGFYRLGAADLNWRPIDEAEPPKDWVGARGLALGQSRYGDAFWWVEGHRRIPSGGIVLLNHDGALGCDVMFVYFARSFAEFIGKVAYFKNLYAPKSDPLFQREYLELNPSVKKSRKRDHDME